MKPSLASEVQRVVDADLCSGCGACTLLSPAVSMELDAAGFLRPVMSKDVQSEEAGERFRAICPGVRSASPPRPADAREDAVFGSYLEAWVGWAIDDEVRYAGSSGGVLTALSGWIAENESSGARVVRPDTTDVRRPIPVTIHSSREALSGSGSRYAPVAALDGLPAGMPAVVAKPCEAVALRALHATGAAGDEPPLILSFFCAGTPSSTATDRAVRALDVDPQKLSSLRYRGNGWPGRFEARDTEGAVGSMTYEESWGKILGRDIQWRCKLCPDGCGESGDIAVGDYWDTDDRGFPLFEDGQGRSVIIARTARGQALIKEAARRGVIHVEAADLSNLRDVQPLQVERRESLAGRLIGAWIAGRRVPRYSGYHLLRALVKRPLLNARYAYGTLRRARRSSRPS